MASISYFSIGVPYFDIHLVSTGHFYSTGLARELEDELFQVQSIDEVQNFITKGIHHRGIPLFYIKAAWKFKFHLVFITNSLYHKWECLGRQNSLTEEGLMSLQKSQWWIREKATCRCSCTWRAYRLFPLPPRCVGRYHQSTKVHLPFLNVPKCMCYWPGIILF